MALKIVGIVDLNWHMVTSRGLVRGLNRMPVNTDGPVFVSFDTVEACDMRPAPMVKMTHLWLDYEPEFLKAHGAFEAGRIVEREIVEALGLMTEEIEENAVRLHSRDEVADGTFAHGDEIVGAMARVPFVFILVISIGFVAMLVASFDSRKREFRVLRAVGATKGQLARVLVGEALKVALWGVVIGLLGGALIGWLAVNFGDASVIVGHDVRVNRHHSRCTDEAVETSVHLPKLCGNLDSLRDGLSTHGEMILGNLSHVIDWNLHHEVRLILWRV
jgi:putative ABC transport system permease protein